MAVDVGSAYVSILPDLHDFGSTVRRELEQSLGQAGQSAGEQAGDAISRAIRDSVDQSQQDLNRALSQAGTQAGNQAGDNIAQGVQEGASAGAEAGGKAMMVTLAAAGLAAGAALAVSIGKAMERDSASDKLAAQLGATPDIAKKYGAIAGELYNNAYGESFSDVTGAIGAVVTSFEGMRNASEADIKAVTANAMDFASAFEIDVARAVSVAGTAVHDGLAVDAKGALDLFTVALQNTPAALRENILDAVEEYGTYFTSFGFSGEQAMGILVEAAKKGQFGIDKIGDAIKESQLLMTDIGAKPVQDAYKAIGLDAEKMAASILKGGPASQEAFQKIVTGLLSIKDPNQQAAASLALFGTPLEDMNKEQIPQFLDAISKGAVGMGDVAGAASKMGQTLNDNAATNLESFKRQVESAFVEFLGNKALPVVDKVASVLATTFGPALSGAADLLKTVWEWLVKHQDIVLPLAAALAGMAAPIIAVALAMRLWAAAQAVWTAITTTATAIQTAWNASLFANPIGLVVLAVVGLIAAVVVAYNKIDWFKSFIDGAWKLIKDASIALFDGYLKPAFEWVRAFVMDKLVPAFLWLWQNVIKPAWEGIKVAIDIAWQVIKLIFEALKFYITVIVAPTVLWLWNNVIKPAWAGISAAIDVAWVIIKAIFTAIKWYIDNILTPVFMFLWNNVIKPVWAGIKLAIDIAWIAIRLIWAAIELYIKAVLAPIFMFLWNNVVKPVWDGIKLAISVAWSAIQAIWNTIKWTIENVLAPVFRWLWTNVISPVWNGIKDTISAVWNNGIKPVLDAVGRFISDTVVPAFRRGVDGIKAAWEAVKEAARKPVEFVVNSVINPIVNGFNSIAGKFGIDPVPTIKGFRDGGKVWGAGTETSDSIPALLSRNEHVWTAQEVRNAGGHGVVANMRQLAKQGMLPAFAGGGIVDWITNPVGTAKAKFQPFLDKLGQISHSDFGKMMAEMPRRIFGGILEKVKGWLGFGGDSGDNYGPGPGFPPWPSGPGASRGDSGVWRSVVALIRSTGPLSGSFGNGYRPGDPLWHGSGRAVDWMGYGQDALASFLANRRPLELIHRTATRDYAYTRGRNMGSFNNSLMEAHRNHVHIAMDAGGWLRQGTQLVTHKPRQPDAVLTNGQWADMRATALAAREVLAQATPGQTINVYPQRADFTVPDLEALQARQNALARAGRPR